MTAEKNNGGFSRWSRRKAAARLRQQNAAIASPASPPAATEENKKIMNDADMPPLETIDKGGGVSAFLSPGVSEDLRRRALARLFQAPRFNLRDGLDDYDDDFTKLDAPLAALKRRLAQDAEKSSQEESPAKTKQTAANEKPPQKAQTAGEEQAAQEAEKENSAAQQTQTAQSSVSQKEEGGNG
jgi:hypothetical protein